MAEVRIPAGWQVEPERSASGEIVPVLTVFLVNRRCPWRCVFCDLDRHALDDGVNPGDIPAQIDAAFIALERSHAGERPRQLKLYNAGSFFDPRAIPVEDHASIAVRAARFERVIVECHPALVGDRVWRFQELLSDAALSQGHRAPPVLEVAMGLETANPAVLPRLGKKLTLEDFGSAASRLAGHGVAMRAFVLVQPPFEEPSKAVEWARRSVVFAFDRGATAVSLIPVRSGTEELAGLAARGLFRPPTLRTLEDALDASLGCVASGRGVGRVFADLWDLGKFSSCASCFEDRRVRLEVMNRTQRREARVDCEVCAGE